MERGRDGERDREREGGTEREREREREGESESVCILILQLQFCVLDHLEGRLLKVRTYLFGLCQTHSQAHTPINGAIIYMCLGMYDRSVYIDLKSSTGV